MSRNVIIAGIDAVCCSEIRSIIESDYPDTVVSSVLCTGEELLSQSLALSPDVIICDANLPGISCFEIIQRLKTGGMSNARFIIFGKRDFDAVYRSLKFGAIDYLLLPISPDSLKTAMDKVFSLGSYTHFDSASRLFYIDDKGISLLKTAALPVEQINKTYGTNFINGLFQMIFVKYDALNSFEYFNKGKQEMLDRTAEQIHRSFEDICADIICSSKTDGVMAVLNYSKENSPIVGVRIQALYNKICRIVRLSQDMTVTLNVSSETADPCNVWELKEQVRDAEWSRMVFGTNKVIYWKHRTAAVTPEALSTLNRIFTVIKTSIESLNDIQFPSAMQKYYALPEEILLTREARTQFKQVLYVAFGAYWDTIAKFTDPTKAYDEISGLSHLCTTFPRHRDTMIAEYMKLLHDISKQIEKEYSRQISDAIYYIQSNIDKPLSLQLVADNVKLSQGYFSQLFKKETGFNFSKFVAQEKNTYACELLKRTDLAISEVAFRTGFPDARAFSKQFKAMNDITPSRYRQLHASPGGTTQKFQEFHSET